MHSWAISLTVLNDVPGCPGHAEAETASAKTSVAPRRVKISSYPHSAAAAAPPCAFNSFYTASGVADIWMPKALKPASGRDGAKPQSAPSRSRSISRAARAKNASRFHLTADVFLFVIALGEQFCRKAHSDGIFSERLLKRQSVLPRSAFAHGVLIAVKARASQMALRFEAPREGVGQNLPQKPRKRSLRGHPGHRRGLVGKSPAPPRAREDIQREFT
jgi:hypothetical protein